MPLTRCQNLAIGLGAVVLLTLTGIAAAFLTSNPSGAQRVPALDGVALEGWRNDEVALAWEQPGNVEPRYFFLNVRTGERTPLPTLPPHHRIRSRVAIVPVRATHAPSRSSPPTASGCSTKKRVAGVGWTRRATSATAGGWCA